MTKVLTLNVNTQTSMRLLIMILLIMIMQIVLLFPAFACAVRYPSADFNADELISYAENIYLVKASQKITPLQSSQFGSNEVTEISRFDYTFEIVEVLKGKKVPIQEYWVYSTNTYDGNDFNQHQDETFWTLEGSRSLWSPLACGSSHTFKDGETYLYFPTALYARKSAEIIRSEDDQWLQYVRNKIALQTQ